MFEWKFQAFNALIWTEFQIIGNASAAELRVYQICSRANRRIEIHNTFTHTLRDRESER